MSLAFKKNENCVHIMFYVISKIKSKKYPFKNRLSLSFTPLYFKRKR